MGLRLFANMRKGDHKDRPYDITNRAVALHPAEASIGDALHMVLFDRLGVPK